MMEKAASYWDEKVTSPAKDLILRWWENPMLHELVDINWHQSTGCATAGEYIQKATGKASLDIGISIGCGAAKDEIALLEQGVVKRFILCDISNEQIKIAKDFALSRGVEADRISHMNFVDIDVPLQQKVDLFYWRHSLHHMLDTERTLLWCKDNLKEEGAIFCNDACPPNYMQWDDEVLNWIDMYRSALPRAYLRSPFKEGEYHPTRPDIPDVNYWKQSDPTECVDSASIIPAIKKHAPSTQISFLGGCIYALGLNDILNNFRNEEDLPLLKNAMLVDKLMSRLGMNHFFACVIRKQDFV
ncbi:MAG TPA: class I SAM-dependent methyltransferase [Sphingomicrobium sp.]|nr:class I SAM-dependent methyltransferase [Sphingomicrobium sp.]